MYKKGDFWFLSEGICFAISVNIWKPFSILNLGSTELLKKLCQADFDVFWVKTDCDTPRSLKTARVPVASSILCDVVICIWLFVYI